MSGAPTSRGRGEGPAALPLGCVTCARRRLNCLWLNLYEDKAPFPGSLTRGGGSGEGPVEALGRCWPPAGTRLPRGHRPGSGLQASLRGQYSPSQACLTRRCPRGLCFLLSMPSPIPLLPGVRPPVPPGAPAAGTWGTRTPAARCHIHWPSRLPCLDITPRALPGARPVVLRTLWTQRPRGSPRRL